MHLLSDEEATELVSSADFLWHQRFHLSPNVVTPGVNDIDWLWGHIGAPESLAGMSVLDIGTTNGATAFMAEARGASRVVATDIFPSDRFGFAKITHALDSKVEFVQGSVYELPEILNEQFDVVFFLGVLYHLRHPLLAIDSVRRLTRKVLYVETAISGDLEDPPAAAFIRRGELNEDTTNWFAPNVACLTDWVESSGFVAEKAIAWPEARIGRASLVARPTEGEPEFVQLCPEVPLIARAPSVHPWLQ